MNKNTGFSETLILPKIQKKNILPNVDICPTIQKQVYNNRQKTKYFIPTQLPKIIK
jgi:hypothetical protein